MQNVIKQYKTHFRNKTFLASLLVATILLTGSLFINIYAVRYATESNLSPVTDLVLNNTKAYDLDGVFVNGAILMIFFLAFVCMWDPKRIPFVLKTIALFVITRSVFISVTHIGAFPTHMTISPSSQNLIQDVIGVNLYSSIFLGNDSFFSGHTGLPFLMALLYWDKKIIRAIFIALSIMFGVVVLLAHVHYSIDVLSAFFISYGVYRLSTILFKKDFKIETSTL